jgi:hypothetical protein
MPTTPPDPPPSTLRRRLAAQRPGRPTAIACAIATALAAVGLDGPRPDNATAAGDRPGAPQLATESPSAMALAHSGILACTTVSLRRAVVGPRPHPGELNRPTLDRRDGRSPFRPRDGGAESARSEADRGLMDDGDRRGQRRSWAPRAPGEARSQALSAGAVAPGDWSFTATSARSPSKTTSRPDGSSANFPKGVYPSPLDQDRVHSQTEGTPGTSESNSPPKDAH